MAGVIGVMGESGAGKTSACRTLDPKKTFYVDADGKGLCWKGWKSQYNKENANYMRTSEVDKIMALFSKVNTDPKLKHIEVIVIDTINAIMVDDEMNRMKEKGYDKWAELAFSVYGLIKTALLLRDDLTVVFIAHTQTERDDNGNVWVRIKTSGRKLDKIVLESKLTTVLHAKVVDGQYVFETHSNNSTAKSPFGCFEEDTVPNDMNMVINKIKEYME